MTLVVAEARDGEAWMIADTAITDPAAATRERTNRVKNADDHLSQAEGWVRTALGVGEEYSREIQAFIERFGGQPRYVELTDDAGRHAGRRAVEQEKEAA